MARPLALIVVLLGALAVSPAFGAGILFKPSSLPGGHVGVLYKVVIEVSVAGHHPALGKDYASYTVACFGADAQGSYMDDCSKLPPGLKLGAYNGPGCAPPLQ